MFQLYSYNVKDQKRHPTSKTARNEAHLGLLTAGGSRAPGGFSAHCILGAVQWQLDERTAAYMSAQGVSTSLIVLS